MAKILLAVYDDAVGFSLRDRDLDLTEIEDVGPVKRMRLHCRAAENLLLSDEVLASLNLTWEELRRRIDAWLPNNATHPHHAAMQAFADSGYDRLNADLKEIRNDIVGLMGTNKPWEVVVGQTLASLQTLPEVTRPTSLAAFLGPVVCQRLLSLPPSPAPAGQAR